MQWKSFLERIDLYSNEPKLNISGKSSISTNGGIFISILVYLLSATLIIYNFINTYKENSPIITVQEDFRNIKELEKISVNDLNFAFGLFTVQAIDDLNSHLVKLKVLSEEVLKKGFIIQTQRFLTKAINEDSIVVGNLTSN